MRRRSILEGSEAPEKSQFQPAKSGDVGDCFRPGDHGEQAQQQDLVERIFDLAALPGVRQSLEIAKEDDRFAKRPGFISRTLHRNPPIGESVDSDDQHSTHLSRTSSPDCPALIANHHRQARPEDAKLFASFESRRVRFNRSAADASYNVALLSMPPPFSGSRSRHSRVAGRQSHCYRNHVAKGAWRPYTRRPCRHRVDPTIQYFACAPLQTGSSEPTSRAHRHTWLARRRHPRYTTDVARRESTQTTGSRRLPELGDRRLYSRLK